MDKTIQSTFEIVKGSIPPLRSRASDAGLDIAVQETTVVNPGETVYLRAGVKFFLAPDMCVNVITRSSTFKKGVVVIPTIVDSNYRHEISTIVTNTSDKPVTIEKGSRLAQCLLQKWYRFANEDFEHFLDDERDEDHKFGSSGG